MTNAQIPMTKSAILFAQPMLQRPRLQQSLLRPPLRSLVRLRRSKEGLNIRVSETHHTAKPLSHPPFAGQQALMVDPPAQAEADEGHDPETVANAES